MESNKCNVQEFQNDLPDLLKMGNFLLRCVGLHPKMLVDMHVMHLTAIAIVHVAPLVIASMINIHEGFMADGDVRIMIENLQLPAGYMQVLYPLLLNFQFEGI